MSEYLTPIVLITIMIVVNGIFVAAEFAIVSVPRTRIAQLAETGAGAAISVLQTLRSPQKVNFYLSTAQIGITVATLGLGMYGEHTIAEWLVGPIEHLGWVGHAAAHTAAVVISVAIITYLHVVVGEMVPKSLALQAPLESATRLSGAMTFFQRIFWPLVVVLNWAGNFLLRIVGVPPADAAAQLVSSEELAYIVEESSEGGLLEPEEQVYLENVLDFQERIVGQVMTPRPRVVGLPVTISQEQALDIICTNRNSRYPVYEDDLDHIHGILHTKDLARQFVARSAGHTDMVASNDAATVEDFSLHSLLRPATLVPETLPLEQMLARFREEHTQIAMVVDEYGGIAGLVTLEDLVEELVGEIQDEFDEEIMPFEQIAPALLRVRGDLLLDELNQHFELNLAHEDADTVGGLVMAMLGRLPQPGAVVESDNAEIEVESVEGLAVHTALIRLPDQKATDHPT